jgi:putative SOS response-associated peptidase YedK
MCGRDRLSSDVSEIKLVFSIPPDRPTPNIAPSWNVAPTDPLPVVGDDTRAGAVLGQGHESRLRKHQRPGRGDRGKSAFREAFQWRRCLAPVDNFYEWKKTATGKQPL